MNIKMILYSVAREFKLIFRNGISFYMVIAPALLAFGFILVYGNIQSAPIKLAVDASVLQTDVQKLETIADLEFFDNYDKLKKRIIETDNIAGVYNTGSKLKLLTEGNEGEEFVSSMQSLVGTVLSSGSLMYNSEVIEINSSFTYKLSMIAILLMPLFIGGATIGLLIVNERESGVIKVVAVSPMRLGSYMITKLIPSLVLSVLGMIAAVLIMGKGTELTGLILLSFFSVFAGGFMIFTIGALAKNQIAAIGILKVLMPVSMVLPITAVFVPESWMFLFYVFPMYWQYASINAVLNGSGAIFQFLMVLITGILWFIPMVILFAKNTNMKVWR